eukprot:TRINITY_DN59483_c1_g4_i1.p1 TRINITY_DN59483_c1_g4~~TRINITY_DN59483_c1_g4_i1.p1  ORF type:complete len:407 (-),score=22.48 TRINITY_DN59483_c1_g4_i1:61-1212(-)
MLQMWTLGSILSFITVASAAEHSAAKDETHQVPSVMMSRPRRPAAAKYYPAQQLLDCDGSNFTAVWRNFRIQVALNAEAGYPKDSSLYQQASKIYRDWQSQLAPGSMKMPQVLIRQIPVGRLSGFCLYGFAAALFVMFRHDNNPEHLETTEQSMGWVEWPLDFAESSNWPTLWRIIPLHLENYRARGDISWSLSLERWGDDDWLMPRPSPAEVDQLLSEWLGVRGKPLWQRWASDDRAALRLASWAGSAGRDVLVLVLGHHMGSSMEPFTMLQEALKVGASIRLNGYFSGQRHPKPGLVCKEFGYCDRNEDLEEWFRRYESRWLGEYSAALDWPCRDQIVWGLALYMLQGFATGLVWAFHGVGSFCPGWNRCHIDLAVGAAVA